MNIYVDYAQGGSFLDWTKTLDGVLTLDFDTVIPGHGPVSTKDDVVKFRADLETMRNRLAGLIKQGTQQGRCVEDARNRLRLEIHRLPSEPTDARLSAVSAGRRADGGIEAVKTSILRIPGSLSACLLCYCDPTPAAHSSAEVCAEEDKSLTMFTSWATDPRISRLLSAFAGMRLEYWRVHF